MLAILPSLLLSSQTTSPVSRSLVSCIAFPVAQESDDEPREEKDHFVAQLYKFMEECGTPINKAPTIAGRDLDLYRLFRVWRALTFNRIESYEILVDFK